MVVSVRRVIALTISCAAMAFACPVASAQDAVLSPPFDGAYSITNIGTPPGVPTRLGGLTLKQGTTDRLLIGGGANGADGALYEIGVVRDGGGHITGFSGTAVRVADAAFNDGGVTYGPGGVLFLARWPSNQLGQTKPGSAITDKIIDLGPLGVASSLASVQFVPPGQPGAGSLKMASYSGGQWYDAAVAADGAGTYNLQNVTPIEGSTLPGGPEGFVYVNAGSPQFSGPSMLVSEYQADSVAAYSVNANGDPVIASRRNFVTGLDGAEGAFFDPVTGDFLFSTFGGGDRVIVISGFARPLGSPAPGKTVNALPVSGTVKIRLPGSNKFVVLGAGQQLPLGTTVDTTKGRVTLVAASDTSGGTAQADFYDGVFKIGQTRGSKRTTTLKLVEKLSCGRGGKASAAAKRKKKRRLWGDGSGRFRTDGSFSSATVRGTRWMVQDGCTSTLTRVARGSVTVRDFVKKKNVVVKAGKKYVARRR
jgi:hypothetical protein